MEDMITKLGPVEKFIALFLPEGKLSNNEELELLTVSKIIGAVFNSVDRAVTLQEIFDAFYNLHYPMSVIEPLTNGETLKPYIETNSHSIYIAIDIDKAKKLENFSKAILQHGNPVSEEFSAMYTFLQQLDKPKDG